jgi:hexosaminidase
VNLGEPLPVNEIKIITGDSKDYITMGDVLISEDGENFEKVASFNELGEAEAKIDNKPLRAVKIQITGAHSCWPIIKEIALK